MSAVLVSLVSKTIPTLGARGFSCAVSGFGQVLKSDPRRLSLRPTADEAPRHTQEKTSGTQGRLYPGSRDLFPGGGGTP